MPQRDHSLAEPAMQAYRLSKTNTRSSSNRLNTDSVTFACFFSTTIINLNGHPRGQDGKPADQWSS